MKLVDVDSIKIDIKWSRHGGKTLFTEAVAEALEKALRDAPPVDAVPIDWIEEWCLSQNLEYVRIAIKKMMDNWMAERKEE